jgi:hypothetical protein
MAFEHLRGDNDDESTNEDGKKALYPECGVHRDAPCDA